MANPQRPMAGHGPGGALPPRPWLSSRGSGTAGRPRARGLYASLAALVAFISLESSSAAAGSPLPVRSILEQRRQNVVLQQYDLSCGAAALATILRYQHGEPTTEREVAIGLISRDIYLANPDVLRSRNGFSLLDMSRYTKQIGYDGQAFGHVAFEDLPDLAPAIVPVRLHGYSHFVVFRGEVDGNVALADPAYGNRTMSVRRFRQSWIEYAEFGHVAFVVRRRDGLIPPNRLAPTSRDFALLH